MNGFRTLLGAGLLAVAVPLAAGEVAYRWVDADGVTHFSDQPPPDAVDAESIDLPEYAIPVTATYSYVALLDRLRAMEAELEATRRETDRDRTVVIPYPVREPYQPVAQPVHFPARLHRPSPQPFPTVDDPRNSQSSFNRLYESRRGPSRPPPDGN